ncbi:MAG TPA: thioesterase family protein [Chryseolinea sp.]|nr:thioesterase family protein [Chryseolinea sp.]
MARVQLELPEKFSFVTELTVRASDLNYGNHVGHDRILTLMQEARISYYRTLGFKNELNFEGPVGQVIADVAVQYKSESFLADVLIIKIAVSDFSKYGFDMYFLIENKTTGKEIARGKTGIVCFDYDIRKVARIPEGLRQKLQS